MKIITSILAVITLLIIIFALNFKDKYIIENTTQTALIGNKNFGGELSFDTLHSELKPSREDSVTNYLKFKKTGYNWFVKFMHTSNDSYCDSLSKYIQLQVQWQPHSIDDK